MGHRTDTPAPIPDVPRHTRLLRRGSVYYLRAKVPVDLQKTIGKKELKWSLKTSDPKEAARIIDAESLKANAIFKAERQRLNPPAPSVTIRPRHRVHPLKIRSEAHAQELARSWFVKLERESVSEFQNGSQKIPIADVLEDLWQQEADITCEVPGTEPQIDDGTLQIRRFLTENHSTLDDSSSEYCFLRNLLRQARLENIRRIRDRLEGKPFSCYDPLFQNTFPHTPPTPKTKAVTVARLCQKFLEDQEKAKLAPKTLNAYGTHARLLRDIFGADTPINEIQRPEVERLCTLLERLPSNAKKRYRGKSASEAIEAADMENNPDRLAPNSLKNYFFNMHSIFDYAVQTKLRSDNPLDDYWFKQRFTPKAQDGEEDGDVTEFTTEELNKIFRAPLYVGCQDDERGYAKPGSNVIRRGRFWVPLIAVFHGLRLNEICQLYTEDMKEEEGELVFEVRVTLETRERATDKRIKRPASRRTVPVHPELLRMGFADYVEQRRLDMVSARLFPELPMAKTGSYSDVFSKWFTSFLIHTLGRKPDATFHSFRHGWRSALREADVSEERVNSLGGWAQRGQSAKYGRAKLVQTLKQEISKVQYTGLDLTHLRQS